MEKGFVRSANKPLVPTRNGEAPLLAARGALAFHNVEVARPQVLGFLGRRRRRLDELLAVE
jgi:hypothetical protein